MNPDPEIYLRRGRDSFRVRVVAEILQDVELDQASGRENTETLLG